MITQIQDFIKSMSAGKRIAIGGTIGAILIGMIAMFVIAARTNYVPLMSNMNPEDSTNVIRILRDKHISFKVDPTGKNISIPQESLYEFRLEMASMGMGQSSVVGYEIFDKQTLGT